MNDSRWGVVWRELALALLRHGYCATDAILQWSKENKFPPLLVRDVGAALAVETFEHGGEKYWRLSEKVVPILPRDVRSSVTFGKPVAARECETHALQSRSTGTHDPA
jgi:hypothetical protein